MDELRVLFMLPRRTLSLLSGATSSSVLLGDSEIECLREGLVDRAFDDDCVFLEKMLEAFFHMVPALTLNKCTEAFLPVEKNTREVYGRMEFMVNFW
jgi:hypothetical protein